MVLNRVPPGALYCTGYLESGVSSVFMTDSGKLRSHRFSCEKLMLSEMGAVRRRILDEIHRELQERDIVHVGGLANEAIVIASQVVLYSEPTNHRVQGFWIRDEMKPHGTEKRLEGPIGKYSGARVALVLDTITTGASAQEAIEVLVEAGYKVVLVIAIVNFEFGGGTENLKSQDFPVVSLITIEGNGRS